MDVHCRNITATLQCRHNYENHHNRKKRTSADITSDRFILKLHLKRSNNKIPESERTNNEQDQRHTDHTPLTSRGVVWKSIQVHYQGSVSFNYNDFDIHRFWFKRVRSAADAD